MGSGGLGFKIRILFERDMRVKEEKERALIKSKSKITIKSLGGFRYRISRF